MSNNLYFVGVLLVLFFGCAEEIYDDSGCDHCEEIIEEEIVEKVECSTIAGDLGTLLPIAETANSNFPSYDFEVQCQSDALSVAQSNEFVAESVELGQYFVGDTRDSQFNMKRDCRKKVDRWCSLHGRPGHLYWVDYKTQRDGRLSASIELRTFIKTGGDTSRSHFSMVCPEGKYPTDSLNNLGWEPGQTLGEQKHSWSVQDPTLVNSLVERLTKDSLRHGAETVIGELCAYSN